MSATAVIERIAPGTKVIDLSHGVPPQDVLTGAIVLLDASPFLPRESVVLAIVDPGSGTDRRPIAVETASGCTLIGPDNGLLSLSWERLGGIRRVAEISSPDVVLRSASRVFDGRDVFAPAAACLADGHELDTLGDAVDPDSLVTRHLVKPDVEPGLIKAVVLNVDRFGNVRLNVRPAALETAGVHGGSEVFVTTPAGSMKAQRISTYHEAAEGEYGLLVDAWDWVSVIRFAAPASEGLKVVTGELICSPIAD